MLPENLPLRPPEAPDSNATGATAPEPGEAQLHSALVTQRNRAITYAVAGASIALSRAAGMLDVHYLASLAIFAIGMLTVAGFSLAARRAERANRRSNLAPWWIACDMLLVTAMVWLTGGVSSPWFLWYLGCAGAAAMHLSLRLAVAGGLASASLYFGVLVALGQLRGPGHVLFLATAHMVFLFGASLFLLANTRDLLRSTVLNRRLKQEADARVDELTRVTQDLESMSRLLRDFTAADPLTGLHNRRYLMDRLEVDGQRLGSDRRAAALGAGAGILRIDVDHFQRINQTAGRAAGDEVLKHLARVLRRCVRGDDILVRWGGDEFLVLVAQSDQRRIHEVAERVLAAVRSQPCTLAGDHSLQLTCSLGWSLFAWRRSQGSQDGPAPWEGALAAAEAALHAAKSAGRDCARHLPPPEPAAAGESPAVETPAPPLLAALDAAAA